MPKFTPPGYVNDLPAEALQKWSDIVESFFNQVRNRKFFFSPFDLPGGATAMPKPIPWHGFPKKYISIPNPDPEYRYKATENPVTKDLDGRDYSSVYSRQDGALFNSGGVTDFLFRDQDEYLEWKAFKNPDGSLNKIVFTCDHPEYWKFIGEYSMDLLLQLYQEFVNPGVQKSDLVFNEDIFERLDDGTIVNRKGHYNPFNKWNTTDGIIHLSHPANYLSAEIQLAADATVLRKDKNGNPIIDPKALITCAQYGNPERSSDPKIGSDVNTLVRDGLSVSINDPVALYIHDLNAANFTLPSGLQLSDFWKVVRGDQSKRMILRAEFAAPIGSGVKLEDIMVNNEPLLYGGQIAECITMAIYGLGYHFSNTGTPTPINCKGSSTFGFEIDHLLEHASLKTRR